MNNDILKIQNDLFFLSQKKKTLLKIGMKNGASCQTTSLKHYASKVLKIIGTVILNFVISTSNLYLASWKTPDTKLYKILTSYKIFKFLKGHIRSAIFNLMIPTWKGT